MRSRKLPSRKKRALNKWGGGVAEDGKGHQEGEEAWTEHGAWITKRAQRF